METHKWAKTTRTGWTQSEALGKTIIVCMILQQKMDLVDFEFVDNTTLCANDDITLCAIQILEDMENIQTKMQKLPSDTQYVSNLKPLLAAGLPATGIIRNFEPVPTAQIWPCTEHPGKPSGQTSSDKSSTPNQAKRITNKDDHGLNTNHLWQSGTWTQAFHDCTSGWDGE